MTYLFYHNCYNSYVSNSIRRFKIVEKRSNKPLFLSAFILAIISLLFVVSAEMGETSSDTSYLLVSFIKYIVFLLLAVIWYLFISRFEYHNINLIIYYFVYAIILCLLIMCRAFGQVGGAYAWLRFGIISIQPSEFAKHMVIMLGAKMFSKDYKQDNIRMFNVYAILCLIYFVVIAFIQKDFGSAFVIAVIWFFVSLLNPYIENRNKIGNLLLIFFIGIVVIGLLLSPIGTAFFKSKSDNYMFGRFLASSNPFEYAYDIGYHVVMSLITFASGGITGVGLGNSIHKHMNFPNPSTDFILPVIVEEGGLITYFAIIVLYLCIIIPVIHYSNKTNDVFSRIVYAGFIFYFLTHFILNVGGVTGLIPLTGIPLLLLSGGGSSLVACFGVIGSCQNEIIRSHK